MKINLRILGVIIIIWVISIGCSLRQVSKNIINSQKKYNINNNFKKQILVLREYDKKFKISPAQTMLLDFPYFGPFANEELRCNGSQVPFIRSTHKHRAFAFITLSYFAQAKDFSCNFVFANNKTPWEKKSIKVGSIIYESYEYPSEKLSADRKRVVLSKKDQIRVAQEKLLLEKIFQESKTDILFSGPFVVPLESKITSFFGVRRVFNGVKKTQHLGTDLRAPMKTKIKPSNEGVVVFAGELFYAGNIVIINHGLGIFTSYAHLSKILVKKGELVDRQKIIGLSGATGRVNGPHLHWGARINGDLVSGFSLVRASNIYFGLSQDS